jgi:hypothetical protein
LSMGTDKFSATVDAELLAELRARVGPRGLSAFVGRALRHELDRVALRDLLDALAVEIGPPDDAMVADAERMLDEMAATTGRRSRRGSAA